MTRNPPKLVEHHADDKQWVKTLYAEVVLQDNSSSSPQEQTADAAANADALGYSAQEMQGVPEEAAVTHGCGNPTALAELRAGEIVLDLGCGGGLDAMLAARRVGNTGKVIGVDMTPEMIDKARANARAGQYSNVEFLLANIETLPLPDDSVDVIISNCVINHSSDKPAVFAEAYRVLKPGGRIFVSDLVTVGKLSDDILRNADKLWASWLAVASDRRGYLDAMATAGFQHSTIISEGTFPLSEADSLLKGRIISLQIRAIT